jgi:hypothetical protein
MLARDGRGGPGGKWHSSQRLKLDEKRNKGAQLGPWMAIPCICAGAPRCTTGPRDLWFRQPRRWRSRARGGVSIGGGHWGGPGHQPTGTGIFSNSQGARRPQGRSLPGPSRWRGDMETRRLERAASKCRGRGGAGRCDAGWGARNG